MIHSDILNSLNDDEKVLLLACINHKSGKEYQYDELKYVRRNYFRNVLQEYYNIVKEENKELYKSMVEKINNFSKSM